MNLTAKDRLILFNQYLILERLDPDGARHYTQAREALERGYSLHYEESIEHFSEDFTEQECEEVRDILDMHRAVLNGYQNLRDTEMPRQEVEIQGFDGNEETRQYSYAVFLLQDKGLWAESRRDDLNSHWPRLDQYRRMLQAWRASVNAWNLSEQDIRRILSA